MRPVKVATSSYAEGMTRTITVEQLRQDPTQELSAVREGAEYLVTDQGVPVARLVPLQPDLWVCPEQAATEVEVEVDPAWAHDVIRDRAQVVGDDPWEPAVPC
jgi:prevent-host-death family protein